MTISVAKTEWDSPVSQDKYKIELTVGELEMLRCALVLYSESTKPNMNNQDHIGFASKCATVINESLVLNGE